MRKISNSIGIAAVMLMMCGCASFLEEHNPVGRTKVYETENDLEAAVEGVLSGFSYGNGICGESNEAFPLASGLLHWGVSSQRMNGNQWLSCLRYTQYSSNAWNGKYFRSLYTPVFRANALIKALETSPVDPDYKTEIKAEAMLYRAVAYFNLVRIWGDVPLRIEEVSEKNATAKPRAPYYKVYEQIVNDLEFARDSMRTPQRAKQIVSGIVRPNKFAATAYLSSVYVTIGSLLASPDDNFWDNSNEDRRPDFTSLGIGSAADAYTKALECAETILPVQDNPYYDSDCEYRLLTKFGDLFEYDDSFSRDRYTSWRHPEQILVFPVSVNSGAGSTYAQYQLPQYPAGTSATVDNQQYGRIRPTRWVFQKWCQTYPGEWRNSNKTEYKSSSDPRLDVTFFYNTMAYCTTGNNVRIYPNTLYTVSVRDTVWADPEKTTIERIIRDTTVGRTGVYPYFRKYASPRYNVSIGDADIYMMRLAEVYFNAIEAAAYLGDEPTARKYMEVIHERARRSVPDGEEDSEYPSWTGVTFSSPEEMQARIFWERMFEFLGESKEYYETHRHGAQWIIDNISKPKNEFMSLYNQSFLFGLYYPEGFKYEENDRDYVRRGLLSGFPIEETLYNSGIENNGRNDFDFGI